MKQGYLGWHRARLFTLLVLALLRLRTVNLPALAKTLHPKRSAETNYRRLQRFFALFRFDFEELAELLLALRTSPDPIVLVMDRTEWNFGQRTINLLVVGYLESGITVPLLWTELDKAGATSEEQRIALMKRVLPLVEPRRVEAFVADREFIGAGLPHPRVTTVWYLTRTMLGVKLEGRHGTAVLREQDPRSSRPRGRHVRRARTRPGDRPTRHSGPRATQGLGWTPSSTPLRLGR